MINPAVAGRQASRTAKVATTEACWPLAIIIRLPRIRSWAPDDILARTLWRGTVITMGPAVLRLFLSHTSELGDLPKDGSFVLGAEHAINRAGDMIVDMKYFTAQEEAPAAYCRKKMENVDVYVGIIGFRYGSQVRGDPGRSYVELEFDTATELGLPRLIFMLNKKANLALPQEYLADPDIECERRQRAFRERLQNAAGTVAMVDKPEQLETRLLQALTKDRASLLAEPSIEQPPDAGTEDFVALAIGAQQKWHDARAVLQATAHTMDRLERRSTAPAGIGEWDYVDQRAVHKRLAASIDEPAAELESQAERAAQAVKAADDYVDHLRSTGSIQFPDRLAPMIKSVSDLERAANRLLDRMTRSLNELENRGCADYDGPSETVLRAHQRIQNASSGAATVREWLQHMQAGSSPRTASVAQAEAQRSSQGPARSNLIWSTRKVAQDITLRGKAAAGPGTLAEGVERRSMWVPPHAGGGEALTVEVQGDSMIEAGLRDGDYVIVDPREEEEDGDILVVLVGNQDDAEAMVKRVWYEGTHIRLESANPDYPAIILGPNDNPQIVGKVTGIFRPVEKMP